MRSTAAVWPMIRLLVALVAGAAVTALFAGWQEGKPWLASLLPPVVISVAPQGATAGKMEPVSPKRLALRFKEAETKQGLGSEDDQRPRPALSGSNRGKSLKQS